MPKIGVHDKFELSYIGKLRTALEQRGIPLKYEMDRAAIDIGVHLWAESDGEAEVAGPRVWFQAKGLHDTTLTAAEYEESATVKTPSLEMDHVRFWYNAPEPVYLALYIESVDTFLAADVRDLVDARGGIAKVAASGATTTFRLSKQQLLERALDQMPRHRSMRIDGPAWRGRPLGHGYDPRRSVLAPMSPELFADVISALLTAHDFRLSSADASQLPVRDVIAVDRPTVLVGKLYLTYEWVLPMMTEIGFDEGSDFRIEGGLFNAQGDVVLVVDPTGTATPESLTPSDDIGRHGTERGIRRVMLMSNSPMDSARFGSWSRGFESDGLACEPQFLDSLAFNVLTTTNVFLEFHERLAFEYVNYL